eukprot:scaffold25466_cov34-Tisochrysis_lutea.AAC.2
MESAICVCSDVPVMITFRWSVPGTQSDSILMMARLTSRNSLIPMPLRPMSRPISCTGTSCSTPFAVWVTAFGPEVTAEEPPYPPDIGEVSTPKPPYPEPYPWLCP